MSGPMRLDEWLRLKPNPSGNEFDGMKVEATAEGIKISCPVHREVVLTLENAQRLHRWLDANLAKPIDQPFIIQMDPPQSVPWDLLQDPRMNYADPNDPPRAE